MLVVNTEIASNTAMTVFGYSDGCVAAARELPLHCNKLAVYRSVPSGVWTLTSPRTRQPLRCLVTCLINKPVELTLFVTLIVP